MTSARTLPWDWYPGTIPENAVVDESAYLETTFSFHLYRSGASPGVQMAKGASAYLGTMFDVGPKGKVTLGEYTLVHGARIVCDDRIDIGDYGLISWNVVVMDTYRLPFDPEARRRALEDVALREPRVLPSIAPARPVKIGHNVWIGFDCCILPGVTIGDGSIIGARSVVTESIPPYTVAVGNPARFVRALEHP